MHGSKAGVDKPDEGGGEAAGDLVDSVDEVIVHECADPAFRGHGVDRTALIGDADGDQVDGFTFPPASPIRSRGRGLSRVRRPGGG